MSKKTKILLRILIVFIIAVSIISYKANENPRVRLFMSTLHFSNKTLKDPAYIAYGIDIMDLFRNYSNADTKFEGRASLHKIKKLNSSTYMNIELIRSSSQKRLACHSSLDILWKNVGNLDMYAEDETVYLVVPILNGVGYAFPTGIDLFMRMPDLTHDINQEWFSQNMGNIANLMREISIVETGNQIVDEDTTKANEFVVTIPEGSGDFLWDLLGMKPPTYDVVVSMYLTKNNYLRRMVMNLSDVLPGAILTIDGLSSSQVIFEYALPENEKIVLTLTRDPNHINYIDINSKYYTNNNTELNTTGYISWDILENGFNVSVKDLEMKEGDELKCKASFDGKIVTLPEGTDIFEGREKLLHGLKVLNWRKIRDDSEEFMDELMNKMKKNLAK